MEGTNMLVVILIQHVFQKVQCKLQNYLKKLTCPAAVGKLIHYLFLLLLTWYSKTWNK